MVYFKSDKDPWSVLLRKPKGREGKRLRWSSDHSRRFSVTRWHLRLPSIHQWCLGGRRDRASAPGVGSAVSFTPAADQRGAEWGESSFSCRDSGRFVGGHCPAIVLSPRSVCLPCCYVVPL
ncbi:hypothetical protein E2C01_018139 [Portunus trituberculatus]|uniref:Uncharacterized protein n=1 Tax=Portunus trituberculatus TaxID=210409 RepID=A0A5B7DTR1_PORTR|nr:hypothetical protein [Portunus trituberculatus]